MKPIIQDVQEYLFSVQDTEYRDFHSKLMPTICPDKIIGVRTPILRKYASVLSKSNDVDDFLSELPHRYYEENNLHAFIIEKVRDYDRVIELLDVFLPYVDNWATCDSMSPKVLKKNLIPLYDKIKEWTSSDRTYTKRFGIGLLMSFYLDEAFMPSQTELVCNIRSDEYYVNMMRAWYFATALAKQREQTIGYIEARRLDPWTHNKTIQKAIESYRISREDKAYLKTLKI